MRSGLAEQFDRELFALLPPILELAGFTTARSKRAWRRKDADCEQLVVVEVDGRSAREGFLEASVSVGINFPWDQPDDRGPLLAGRGYAHQPERLAPDGVWETSAWRYDGHAVSVRALAEYVEGVVLAAL